MVGIADCKEEAWESLELGTLKPENGVKVGFAHGGDGKALNDTPVMQGEYQRLVLLPPHAIYSMTP